MFSIITVSIADAGIWVRKVVLLLAEPDLGLVRGIVVGGVWIALDVVRHDGDVSHSRAVAPKLDIKIKERWVATKWRKGVGQDAEMEMKREKIQVETKGRVGLYIFAALG